MSTIAIARENRTVVVSLNNPPLNIMTIALMDELSDALAKISSTDAAVVILKGEGKCFSAGADVKEHLPDLVETMMRSLHRLFVTISDMEIPVIASIHGNALGGGMELALCADIIYAANDAKLGQPEILLGVFAPYAAAMMPFDVGIRKTHELLLTGKSVSGEEAARCGLINATCPAEELAARVRQTADHIASLSRSAVRLCKKAVRRVFRDHVLAAIKTSESIYLDETMKTPDAHEGLNAFLSKRKPVWKS